MKMEEQEKENSNAEEGDSVLEESLKEEECKISAKDRKLLFTEGVKELVNDKKHIIDWRIGWNFLPRNIDDVIDMMESLSIAFHADWLAAMEMGEAPSEDVSPGETFMLCRQIIRNMKKKLEKYEPTENNKNEDEESK